MQSHFYHIQVNINFENAVFYNELFDLLGWSVIYEGDKIVGYRSAKTGDIWFLHAESLSTINYDSCGAVNHIGIRVAQQMDVDTVMQFLTEKNIQMLFDTPRHRSEFVTSENETYYQIMFESPDRILFEIVYIGPKSA